MVSSKRKSRKVISKKVVVCKEDEELNQATGRCRKKCKEGEERNEETGKCRNSKKVASKKVASKKVDSKKVASRKKLLSCKEDEELNQATGRCRKKCKEGEERNEETGKCRKIRNSKKVVSSRVSPIPSRVSPSRVSPSRVSPSRVSPSRVSPSRVSPKKANIVCKEDEEINPVSGRCRKKCKEGEERNEETGKCRKIKGFNQEISLNENSKKECNICADTISKNKFVSCPYCSFECCKNCMETFLLSLNDDTPRCMDSNCKKTWSLTFVADNFSKQFFNTTYRNRRTAILLDREKSLLPEAQLIIQQREREKKISNLEYEIRKIQRRYDANEDTIRYYTVHEQQNNFIANGSSIPSLRKTNEKLMKNIIRLEQELAIIDPNARDDNAPTRQNNVRNVIIMKCPANDCRGFVNTDYVCGLCNVSVCKRCRIIVEDKNNHTCNKDLVETVKLLAKDTKNCPSCSTPIFKIDGCDQMYCTLCHTAFSWTTGIIEKGVIHNPHYYQYMREKGLDANAENRNRRQPQQCGLGIRGIMDIIYSVETDRNIRNVLHESHRMIAHIQDFIRRNIEPNFVNLRIEFLQNEIDEPKWKETIKRIQKRFEKDTEVNMILEMVANATRDLFTEFENSSLTPDGLRQPDNILLENINTLYTSIVNLHQYANDELLKIRQQYNNLTPIFFNGILCDNENSKGYYQRRYY